MLAFLRFVGTFNAALWLGMAVFFTFAVGPSFFSQEMLAIFGGDSAPFARAYAGASAMVVMKKYFLWLHVCGALAVLTTVAEAVYQGLSLKRLQTYLAMGAFLLGLAGGLWMQPRLQQLQGLKYHPTATPAQREAAGRSFSAWHAASQGGNGVMTLLIVLFFWKVISPPPRSKPHNPFQFKS